MIYMKSSPLHRSVKQDLPSSGETSGSTFFLFFKNILLTSSRYNMFFQLMKLQYRDYMST